MADNLRYLKRESSTMVSRAEIGELADALRIAARQMPKHWDGREAILEMKNSGGDRWRQMEWMEFYFEFLCEKTFGGILDMPGKSYDKAGFDAFRKISWDFKALAANADTYHIVANDTEAIGQTIDEHGYYGLILATGEVDYNDQDRAFKRWHDELKGGASDHALNRIERGVMSMRRVTKFALSEIHFVCLNDDTMNQCCGLHRKGFRNSAGRPQQSEVWALIDRLPNEAILATEKF